MKIKTHKPNATLWLIAFLLFVYALAAYFLPMLPYSGFAVILSAALLLIGTTVV
ncbi:MAG: hypothetical protein HZC40_21065 [Chloroflexi bacterium]|nr:hypothetical protein [Chloroflexota bacterium]